MGKKGDPRIHRGKCSGWGEEGRADSRLTEPLKRTKLLPIDRI